VGSSNVGGHLAPELKYAGFDSVIIEGEARDLVYLVIHDAQVELREASHLKGKTTWQVEDALREELGDHRLRIASIGPAGENLVKGACLIVDRSRAAGRGGAGAIWGSKKLKAIAVRGTHPIHIYHPKDFLRHVEICWEKVRKSPIMELLRAGGTLTMSRQSGGWNHQDEGWISEKFARIQWQVFRDNYAIRRAACFNCPVYCSHSFTIKEGPYAGAVGEGLEANSIRAFGCSLDIDDPAAIIKAHAVCSQLGIDIDFAGAALGWAFESYQKGLLSRSDTEGLELTWGNHGAALKLLEKICFRQGIGRVLADGVKMASDTLRKGSEKWALQIKGADLNESNMRFDKAWALGICTAARGGGHLEGAPIVGIIEKQLSPKLSQKLFGIPEIGSITSYENKEKVIFYYEKLKSVTDAVGMCYLLSQWMGLDLIGPEDYVNLLTSATGIQISPEALMRLGQRIHNIEKAFNTLHANFTREDDFPPYRYMEEQIKSGPYVGEVLARDDWNRALDAYYAQQGWDSSTGRQTETILKELGLNEISAKLKKYRKL
jgi:aldehyde:ferredoxin oxidoreductase